MFVRLRHLAVIVIAVALGSCGDGTQGPPAGGGAGGGQNISGNERLGWDVQAADRAELGQIRYAIYLDSVRSELAGVTCGSAPGASGFPCSAPLPSMTPGEHTIELASFVMSGTTVIESTKSPPLRVRVGSGVGTGLIRIPGARPGDPPAADDTLLRDRIVTTADGVRLKLHVGPRFFDEPTDLAEAPDGRIFVTERSGRVALVEPGRAEPRTALLLEDVDPAPAGGLLAIALSPAFPEDSHVFLLYAAPGSDGPVFRIARYREVGGTFGERAVIFDNVPASPARAAGTLRFGPDGRLYVALDDSGNPAEAERAGSFNGKVLRLNADGTTPADRRTTSPVYSAGHHSPHGLDWEPSTGALWVLDHRAEGEALTLAASGTPLRLRRPPLPLPRQTGGSGLAAYRHPLLPPLDGDLLVAAAGSGNLLRLRAATLRSAMAPPPENLLPEGAGPIRAVTVTRDGRIVAVGASLVVLSPAGR